MCLKECREKNVELIENDNCRTTETANDGRMALLYTASFLETVHAEMKLTNESETGHDVGPLQMPVEHQS